MTVRDLIKLLKDCPDKDALVYAENSLHTQFNVVGLAFDDDDDLILDIVEVEHNEML